MKFFLIVLASFQITLTSNLEQFMTKHETVYKNQNEEPHRQKDFLENMLLVEDHSRKHELGLQLMNQNKMLPARQVVAKSVDKVSNHKIFPEEEVPDSIDWRDYGVISPIADQQGCETCWAFAIVGTIEAHWAIYKGQNISLSQQNLADCVDPTFTCSTDLQYDILDKTYQYIIDNGGIDTAASYPYEYYTVGECRFNTENVAATISGYANITEGDEEELKRIVGTVGPVTVAISTTLNWNIYSNGIFYDEKCNELDFLNHAVVVVGYGTEDGEDYWLVKNSWGTWFGQDGYIRMARNRNNHCGIASIAKYPLIE